MKPKKKLIDKLKAEGIIPLDCDVQIDIPRYSQERREVQHLPRLIIQYKKPGAPLWRFIYGHSQTVAELLKARKFYLYSNGPDEAPDIIGE